VIRIASNKELDITFSTGLGQTWLKKGEEISSEVEEGRKL